MKFTVELMPMKSTNNSQFISLASVLSALAVVTLHTNGCFWIFSATESYWFSANIIECICYFSVPVFFMITGATNLDFYDKYSIKTFYLKRIKKTVIPYVAWSIIGLLYLVCLGEKDISEITLWSVIRGLSEFNIISIFWFFGPLFGVYLCMPLFAGVKNELKNTVYLWLAGIAFAFNIVFPFIIKLLDINYTFPLTLTVGSGYLFYVMVGYLIYKNDIPLKARIFIYIMSIGGLLIHIIGTYTLSMEQGSIVETYKGYVAVPCVLYSVGIFIFIKQLSLILKSKKFWWLISILSKYTFSLYLLQWFILHYINHYTSINTLSMLYRLGAPFIIFAIVIVVTYVLRKIPILRHIVP